MTRLSKAVAVSMSVAILASVVISVPQAEAGRFGARGQNGGIGGFARQGQYGQAAGGGFIAPGQGGAGFHGGSFSGPNGGSAQGGGAFGFKNGQGGFRASQFNATGPNGNSAAGYSNNVYNAQTGTGTRNSGKSANTANGSYGYDASTNYTKGQGATTTVDTQNHGQYQIDASKGSRPTVTQTTAE